MFFAIIKSSLKITLKVNTHCKCKQKTMILICNVAITVCKEFDETLSHS